MRVGRLVRRSTPASRPAAAGCAPARRRGCSARPRAPAGRDRSGRSGRPGRSAARTGSAAGAAVDRRPRRRSCPDRSANADVRSKSRLKLGEALRGPVGELHVGARQELVRSARRRRGARRCGRSCSRRCPCRDRRGRRSWTACDRPARTTLRPPAPRSECGWPRSRSRARGRVRGGGCDEPEAGRQQDSSTAQPTGTVQRRRPITSDPPVDKGRPAGDRRVRVCQSAAPLVSPSISRRRVTRATMSACPACWEISAIRCSATRRTDQRAPASNHGAEGSGWLASRSGAEAIRSSVCCATRA